MADVLEMGGVALRRPAETHRPADPEPSLVCEPAANDAALGRQPPGLDEAALRTLRGFATGMAIGAVLWTTLGALVWLSLP